MDRAVRLTYGMTLAGFEQRWQRQTRRRYGALALVGDVTLAGLLLLVIIFPLYMLRAPAGPAPDGRAGGGRRGGRSRGAGERDRGAVARGRRAGIGERADAVAAILISP